VVPGLEDDDILTLDEVNEPMLFADASGPATG
jgi:hypothetical protein